MTITCNDIITRAFRMRKILAVGDEPQDSEADEAMGVLESIYLRLAETALRPGTPVFTEEDYEAEEGERVYGSSVTITLPETVIDGEERRPLDLAAIATNEGSGWEYWVSDRGDWIQVNDLEQADEAPFADRNKEGLAALLALELDTFGGEVTPAMEQKARRFQAMMQPVNDDPVEYY